MTTHPDQQFTDFEIRFILTEVIKHSNVPQQRLVDLIKDANIDPAWNDLWLPNGRSINNCKVVYDEATNPQPRGTKRPFSAYATDLPTNVGGREIVPRPPGLIGAGEPSGASTMLSPAGKAPGAFDTPPRKRGRPTKEESARREAEAKERGEEYPKPRKRHPKLSVDTQTDGGSSQATASKLTSAKSAESSKPSTASGLNPMAVAAANASLAGASANSVGRPNSNIRRPSTQQSLTSSTQLSRAIGTSVPMSSTIGIGSPISQFNQPMNPGMYTASNLTTSPNRLSRNTLFENSFGTSQSDKQSRSDGLPRPFGNFNPANRLSIPESLGQDFSPRLHPNSRHSTQPQSQLSFIDGTDLSGMSSGMGTAMSFPPFTLDGGSEHSHGHTQTQQKGSSNR